MVRAQLTAYCDDYGTIPTTAKKSKRYPTTNTTTCFALSGHINETWGGGNSEGNWSGDQVSQKVRNSTEKMLSQMYHSYFPGRAQARYFPARQFRLPCSRSRDRSPAGIQDHHSTQSWMPWKMSLCYDQRISDKRILTYSILGRQGQYISLVLAINFLALCPLCPLYPGQAPHLDLPSSPVWYRAVLRR